MRFKDKFKYFEDSRFDHRPGFNGSTESPEYAIFLAHRMARSHYRNSDVTEIASMAAQMAERLIDFEADLKKTVAGNCSPDEKHCSCVPHLWHAYFELSNQVVQTFAPHLGFPRAPDENGKEDPNAPYVVDSLVAEDIIDLADKQFQTWQAWMKEHEPQWSSEVPTEPGHYWFYGTSEAERRSPYERTLKSRLCQFRLAGGENKYLAVICEGNFIYPASEGYVGKWLKFTPPTP